MTRMLRYGAALLIALTWVACGDDGGGDPTNDVLDAIQTDNYTPDQGQTDQGQTDEGQTDEGQTDEGQTDEGQTDEGQTDEGQTDEGQTDEGQTDEGQTDEGQGETIDPIDEFATLVEWLEGDGGNYINSVAAPRVISAADVVADGLDNWVILDLRTQDKYGPDGDGIWHLDVGNGVEDYDDGHIADSIKVKVTDVLAYVKANLTMDDKILVICYTGQNAGIVTLALNLLGYDASSMKWGMSAWNEKFDNWTLNTSSTYWDQFVTTADTGRNESGDYPVLATGATDVQGILESRLDTVLAGTPKYVKPVNLFATLDDYYVINYWPEAEYLDPGHIPGSHQYTPKTSLLTTSLLSTLPTDMPIAVYCYSGQHSAQVVTYLNVLGYDAFSVLYGTNGMMYDEMTKQAWPGPVDGPGDYPWEPTPAP